MIASGTTWLQLMLDQHPEIVCSGEGHFCTHIIRPLSELVKNYNVLLAKRNRQVYDANKTIEGITKGELVLAARSLIRTVMYKRLKNETKWIGDKTPHYFDCLPDLSVLFPDCRIIHAVRDPRDVAVSSIHFAKRIGDKEGRQGIIHVSTSRWNDAQKACAKFKSNGGNIYEVKYEDCILQAGETLCRLFEWLDVRREPQLVQTIINATSFEAASGRKAGAPPPPNAFLRRGIMGDWRNELSEEEAREVESRCAQWMDAKGYV